MFWAGMGVALGVVIGFLLRGYLWPRSMRALFYPNPVGIAIRVGALIALDEDCPCEVCTGNRDVRAQLQLISGRERYK